MDRTCSKREIELQELAVSTYDAAYPLVCKHVEQLRSSAERAYYLEQISVRISLLVALRYGLNDND